MNEQKTQLVYGLITGALIGAGVAALLAPKTGREMRADLMDLAEMVKERGPELNERGHELTEKGREVVEVVKESIGVAREWKEQVETATEEVKHELAEFKEQQDSENATGQPSSSSSNSSSSAASSSNTGTTASSTTPPAGSNKTSNYSV